MTSEDCDWSAIRIVLDGVIWVPCQLLPPRARQA
jgi:hypothetical protein